MIVYFLIFFGFFMIPLFVVLWITRVFYFKAKRKMIYIPSMVMVCIGIIVEVRYFILQDSLEPCNQIQPCTEENPIMALGLILIMAAAVGYLVAYLTNNLKDKK